MNKKALCPIEAATFNAKYADIAVRAKLVRDELKKNISILKKLSREAEKLYGYGYEKCHTEDDKGVVHQIDGIKNLGFKLDDLDQLTAAHDELQDLVDNLTLFK